MHNPPRPSIAQPSRKSRLSRGLDPQDPAQVQLTMPKVAEPGRKPGAAAAPEAPAAADTAAPAASSSADALLAAPSAVVPAPTPTPTSPEPSAAASFAVPAVPVADAAAAPAFSAAPYQPKFKPYGAPESAPRRFSWAWAFVVLALLAAAGAGGYWFGVQRQKTLSLASGSSAASSSSAAVTDPLAVPLITAAQQRDLDAAFSSMKDGKFLAARAQLDALLKLRPDWTSLRFETARVALYQRNYSECEKLVADGEKSSEISVADGEFLKALMHMNGKQFDVASESYARAAAADPARADIYYFWGENLRRQGKPSEAADRFRSALLRNQYETADNLYTLKLWLSQIQAGQELSSGLGDTLAARLAEPNPSSAALLAAAARAIKNGDFDQAGDYIAKARRILDPLLFDLALQDPTFVQESWRPALSGFYPKPAPEPAAPAASPAPGSEMKAGAVDAEAVPPPVALGETPMPAQADVPPPAPKAENPTPASRPKPSSADKPKPAPDTKRAPGRQPGSGLN